LPGETPSTLHNKRLAIRWLPSARFEQRCSSLDIWRCFLRARRVIVPPSCNNQQRRPANITPHLLPCSEATFGVSLAEPVAAHLLDNTNAPRVQTLHLLERTQAALAPLGAAVHCSAHLIQPYEEKRCITFLLQNETAFAPRACHRMDQDTLACATMCIHR